ncbi:MAG TPA: TIR domain-containing protein [Longimicrobiaceae bacterium]
MRPPRVFIGSSSEAKESGCAQLVVEVVASLGAAPLPWWHSQAFPTGIGFLEALEATTRTSSAALLIATPDDRTVIRGETHFVPRDNVLLEYGLFTGALGRDQVALVLIGPTKLPSDLAGVTQIQIAPRTSDRSLEEYKDLELIPKLRPWIERLKSRQDETSPDAEIRELIREFGPERTARLIGEARFIKSRGIPLPRYPHEEISQILRMCALPTAESVGIGRRVPLNFYIKVADLPPDSLELNVLACAMCNRIADECEASHIRPTHVAVLKTGAIEFGQRVAELLDYPIIYVTPLGPNKSFLVDGAFTTGDNLVIIHDVIVTGDSLVRCASEIRRRNATVEHVFALAHYSHPACNAPALLSANNLRLHYVTTVNTDWFAGLPA